MSCWLLLKTYSGIGFAAVRLGCILSNRSSRRPVTVLSRLHAVAEGLDTSTDYICSSTSQACAMVRGVSKLDVKRLETPCKNSS